MRHFSLLFDPPYGHDHDHDGRFHLITLPSLFASLPDVEFSRADLVSEPAFLPLPAPNPANTYDSIVLHANRVTAIGGPSGYPVRGVGGAVAHEIVYSGAIKLVRSTGPFPSLSPFHASWLPTELLTHTHTHSLSVASFWATRGGQAPALTTSFRAPNLQVAYLLCITL